jgi:hypothetical protein
MRYRFRADNGSLFPMEENDFPSREYRAPEEPGRVTVYAECQWCPGKVVVGRRTIEVKPRGALALPRTR